MSDGTWISRTGKAKAAEDSHLGQGIWIDNVGFISFLLKRGKTPLEIKKKLEEHNWPIYNHAICVAIEELNWSEEKKESFIREFYDKRKKK